MKLNILVITFISLLSTISVANVANTANTKHISVKNKLTTLAKNSNVKIGVYAIDTNSHKIIAYQANALFPFQSTFKVIGVAKLLKDSENNRKLLDKKIFYSKKDLVSWHPVTGKHVNTGMTLKSLARATISYSDNPAINLIMKNINGPNAVTAFAHDIGNKSFNLKHYEPNLNSNPQRTADSATPKDMALSLEKLLLGDILQKPEREELLKWMRNNTTGYNRIRAGVPVGWIVADKTGSGDFGIANDIGIVWSPTCKPIVLVVYTVGIEPNAKQKSAVIAEVTKIVINAYSKIDYCFKTTKLNRTIFINDSAVS